MTADEKISLARRRRAFGGVAGGEGTHTGTSDGIERLGIPTIYFSDGPAGVRSGMATAMPSPISLGASFDPRNSARDAGVIADEVIKKGNDIVFAPTVDIVRTPLAGRVFEAMGGEDPFLSAHLAVPWIKTVQEQGPDRQRQALRGQQPRGHRPGGKRGAARATSRSRWAGSRPKATGCGSTPGSIERTLRELYLPMFEAAVKKANVASVMCAYNKINGAFACENKPLLEDILRGDWGFDGMTIADYNAAHDASASLINGLDIEPWPGIVYGPNSVSAALATGPATMADVDRHILRYLRTLFAYGAMDRAAYEPNEAAIDQAAHAAKSRRVAEEGMVLLRNDGVLPLKRKSSTRSP